MKKFYIHLCAPNDTTNGNPRRCFVVFSGKDGHVLEVIDEGYGGGEGLKKYGNDISMVLSVRVLPSEYKMWLTIGKGIENERKGIKK